jgi:hypothetical protein
MVVEEQMDRWVFASVSKHFDDRKGSIPLFIEGQHRDTNTLKDFAELRMDGPRYVEVSKGFWELRAEVNILIQSAKDDQNYHRNYDTIGIMRKAFTCIEVLRYGTTVPDDGTVVGYLKLLQDTQGRDFLEINNFGQVDPKRPLMQATVEGHYRMYLNR